MARQKFDADARSKEREETPAVIGGQEFFPRRLTNTVIRDVRRLALEAEQALKDNEDDPEAQDESYRSLIRQIARLLGDAEGKAPEEEFLMEHLDTRDAGALIQWLMEDESGNASEPEPETATA